MTTDIMRMGSNPRYLGSWDLEELPGQEVTVQIDRIVDEVVFSNGNEENCTVAYFTDGNVKPMILNLTNKKILCKLFQTRDAEDMKGKNITVGVEQIRAFGGIIDALRIRTQLQDEEPVQDLRCELCGEPLDPVGRMTRMQLAAYTRRRCGKCLCAMCATKVVRGPVCD